MHGFGSHARACCDLLGEREKWCQDQDLSLSLSLPLLDLYHTHAHAHTHTLTHTVLLWAQDTPTREKSPPTTAGSDHWRRLAPLQTHHGKRHPTCPPPFLLLGAGATTGAVRGGGRIIPPLGRSVTLRNGVVMPSIRLGSSGHCHPDQMAVRSLRAATTRRLSPHCDSVIALMFSLTKIRRARCCLQTPSPLETSRGRKFSSCPWYRYLMGFNETIAAVDASLQQLQLKRIDLVMVHHPRVTSAVAAECFENERVPRQLGSKWISSVAG